MGGIERRAPKTEKVTVLRPTFEGEHDLYDVLFVSYHGHVVTRKVGITARGHARYADVCKTLHMSIQPHAPAVTYPSKEAALAAEKALIATICQDPEWIYTGKECFASVKPMNIPATEGAGKTNKEVKAA
jgi:hypothetical protein